MEQHICLSHVVIANMLGMMQCVAEQRIILQSLLAADIIQLLCCGLIMVLTNVRIDDCLSQALSRPFSPISPQVAFARACDTAMTQVANVAMVLVPSLHICNHRFATCTCS